MDIVWQAEDSLREKKVESDLKDLLKTMVAFANSVAPGDTAKIFIGEKDDGTVQGVTNTDNIQKRVKKEADEAYPEIYYRTEVYEREGKQCVRVDIKHNGLAPHFAGPAWVRKGSQTNKATEELYQQMIDQRQAKTRVLLQWLDKDVTVWWKNPRTEQRLDSLYRLQNEQATLTSIRSYWATFRVHLATVDESNQIHRESIDCSEPMEKLMLSWDDGNGRLKVEVWG
jgi:hypothetical protein